MEIRRIDHIGIRVMEFERSSEFYKKLGFQTVREDDNGHVVVMKHPSGIVINLLDSGNNDNNQKNILMDVPEKYTGYTHYAIEVQSTADAREFLESINVNISEGPVTFGNGQTSIFVRDPDLNVIEFTELPKS